jgi:hypothetical protein
MQNVVKILRVCMCGEQRKDDGHLSQTESRGRNASTQRRQLIFVAMADLLDQPMSPQALEQRGNLPAGFLKLLCQVLVLKTGDVKPPAHKGLEHIQISAGKQVKASQRTISLANWKSNFLHVFECAAGIILNRDKFQVPPIGRAHQLDQHWQTVNGLLQRGGLHLPGAVAMFHPTVVFKDAHVVGRGLNSHDQSVFAVHFNYGVCVLLLSFSGVVL